MPILESKSPHHNNYWDGVNNNPRLKYNRGSKKKCMNLFYHSHFTCYTTAISSVDHVNIITGSHISCF